MGTDLGGDDKLLDRLFMISGDQDRSPSEEAFFLVCSSLHHCREDIRERAIFIGGLRWRDPTILGYFRGALLSQLEAHDDNCRLMVECLVSEALESGGKDEYLSKILQGVIDSYPHTTLAAKAAFIGLKRLRGEIDKKQFAVLEYEDIEVIESKPT